MWEVLIILSLMSMLITFCSILIFLAKWIKRKPKKEWGFVALVSFLFIPIFGIWGSSIAVEEDKTLQIQNKKELIEASKQAEEKSDASLDSTGNLMEIEPNEIRKDSFEEKLLSFGFTQKEAEENAKILKLCGIPRIDICEPLSDGTIDGLIVFRGKLDENHVFWFTVDKRKIFYVALNGIDLYDLDKGGYLKNFQDAQVDKKSNQ